MFTIFVPGKGFLMIENNKRNYTLYPNKDSVLKFPNETEVSIWTSFNSYNEKHYTVQIKELECSD